VTRDVMATRTASGTAPRRPASRLSPVRTAVRAFGEVLITLGLVVLLFCAYQLFYSNLEAGRAQNRITADLQKRWAAPELPAESPESRLKQIPLGDGFALIRIPRLGSDWVKPVVEGVGPHDLSNGLGHYPTTALPGKVGNLALAGHRATHGEPFRDLDQMREGDAIVIETRETWYVYRVDRTEIVLPTQVDVIEPVPNRPGVKPTKRLITLTTCNPRWASYQRLIVYGHLAKTQQKSAGIPDVLTSA
jgi:sortase A